MKDLNSRLDFKAREMVEMIEFAKTMPEVPRAVEMISKAFKTGHKLFAAGNGGSACNADSMIGKFVSQVRYQRESFAAFSVPGLSGLTATSNDFGFEKVYARQVQGALKSGDIFVGYSCSGNSPNILAAVQAANEVGAATIGFSGWTGKLYKAANIGIAIPPCNWQTLEEVHLILTHLICELVEERICASDPAARLLQ